MSTTYDVRHWKGSGGATAALARIERLRDDLWRGHVLASGELAEIVPGTWNARTEGRAVIPWPDLDPLPGDGLRTADATVGGIRFWLVWISPMGPGGERMRVPAVAIRLVESTQPPYVVELISTQRLDVDFPDRARLEFLT